MCVKPCEKRDQCSKVVNIYGGDAFVWVNSALLCANVHTAAAAASARLRKSPESYSRARVYIGGPKHLTSIT